MTGVILDRGAMSARTQVLESADPQWSSRNYAEINYEWLPSFNEKFREHLFKEGIPVGTKMAWSEQFNCVGFTDLYIGLARIELFQQAFHVENQKELGLPAILAVWYQPDDSDTGHSIVAIVTNKGLIFIEPQTGKILQLSQSELNSVWHRRS